jgi:hypothetical protein
MESINKYINYDGEVYEKDEESEELIWTKNFTIN